MRVLLCHYILLVLLAGTSGQVLAESAQEKLSQQRETYQKALHALKRGARKTFRSYTRQLEDYPLYPYLQYADLSIRIRRLPRKEIERFLSDYDSTPVARRLRVRWLKELKRRRRGEDFLRYYDPVVANTEFACYHEYARYRVGNDNEKHAALNQALKLWLVGKSQPDGCNKLFDILRDTRRITDEIAWRRYTLALSNRQYQLARYLRRYIKAEPYRDWAANASAASKNPALIGKYDRFRDHSPENLIVIEHVLRRLTSTNAPKALTHWAHYKQTHPFSVIAQSRVTERLVKGLYRQDNRDAADEYLSSSLNMVEPPLLEWRIREALSEGDWPDALVWIEKLPDEYGNEPRWRYWHARLGQMVKGEDPTAIYAELAQKRSYYGFIASELLGGNYAMQHQPVTLSEAEISEVENLPGIQRVRELKFHGEKLDARREWYSTTRNFSEIKWLAAAEVARLKGWYNLSIMSMIKASYWNDIEMRFPLVYREQVDRHAGSLNMDTHLLLALARQESALAVDAVSPVGARGLMQLMPTTAKQIARKHGITYKGRSDLMNPDKNIELGTRYYRDMLDRFDDNRILATAAYNAGPSRVNRWLKKSGKNLPWDVWIETIPFRETRHYVQNVLAFSAIYAHLLGNHTRILTETEKQKLL